MVQVHVLTHTNPFLTQSLRVGWSSHLGLAGLEQRGEEAV